MKLTLNLILFLAIYACKQSKPTHFFSITYLKYSAYSRQFIFDGSDFYLAQYFNMDKNGHFILMRHNSFMDSPKYFTGFLTDSFLNLINATFDTKTFETDYLLKPADNFIYAGFNYCFDYKSIDGMGKKIMFIPPKSPPEIKKLGQLLDTLIYFST